jgi:hypothetical protein
MAKERPLRLGEKYNSLRGPWRWLSRPFRRRMVEIIELPVEPFEVEIIELPVEPFEVEII